MAALPPDQEPSVSLSPDGPATVTEVILPGTALYLHHLLAPHECAAFRQLMDTAGDVTDFGSGERSYQYRKRAVCRQEEAMAALWVRVRKVMEEEGLLGLTEPEGADWEAVGLNEMVRLVSYPPGGKFDRHCDSCFSRSDEERSWWTLNIYLNTVAEEDGGATVFLEGEQETPVQPEEGAALLFFQPNLLHEGRPLLRGEKWLLRSDVMFRRLQPVGREEAEARRLHREAQHLEVTGRSEQAWRSYARAFKLWPSLERDPNMG